MTSRSEGCAVSHESASGTAVTLLPQILLLCTARMISLGDTATVNAALPSEVSVNVLQGQTYTVIDLLLCVRILRVQITSGSPNVKVSKAFT